MNTNEFRNIFPTSFSKVSALLLLWGIADLKKLEEINLMNTSEIIYNDKDNSNGHNNSNRSSYGGSNYNSNNSTPISSPSKSIRSPITSPLPTTSTN
jgi:hypothetical protein